MTFNDFDELINSINKSLGDFCNTFIYKRKELSQKERSTKRGFLFVYDKSSNRNWAINEGGGTEIQYHIAFNLENLELYYGLGFNTQYVPHANEISSVDYMRPFMKAFLNNETIIQSILPNYSFVYGEKNMLIHPQPDQYSLFGRNHKIQKISNNYFIEDLLYNEILEDLKKQFEGYQIIFKEKNKLKNMSSKIEKHIGLLEYKKQIILQGPPGTGKTKTAKELAIEILHLEDIRDLNNNEQFKLIQFHPSYTYEDFVRGIVSKPNENSEGVLFKTENKILAEFADKAFENLILSQEDNSIALQDKWIEDAFEEFKAEIEEKIEQENLILSGTISVFNVAEDCFRYGKDWQNPSRINFIDFKVLIKAVIQSGFDVNQNSIPKILSIHAHYRFTYYLALLRLFFEKHEYTSPKEKVLPKNYVLVIDEINRANLPAVLGELIYALEYRNEFVESIYELDGTREIILPSNLYIIGTMNTADRSVGHIDYAIRRRFAFIDILPKDLSDDQEIIFDSQLFHLVKELFTSDDYKTRSTYLSTEFEPKDVTLGHSYFIDKREEGGSMGIRLEYEIKPILREYVKDGILKETVREKIEQLSSTI